MQLNDTVILIAVFTAVLILVFTLANTVTRRREISRNLDKVGSAGRGKLADIDKIFSEEHAYVQHYYNVQRNAAADGLDMRLIRAGFLSPKATQIFNVLRFAISAGVFILTWAALNTISGGVTATMSALLAMMLAGVTFILCSAGLDYFQSRRLTEARRLFPDLMDLLIVCVDAGMSIEAALDRVAREFLRTNPLFGFHLSIISLETRAGRPLHEALANFAERTGVEEAKILATLFRQSQELGASVIRPLRVFSTEMRETRMIKAEEKANALPVKMLFPMAGFLFPVNLVIVLVPVMIMLIKMFTTLKPGG